MRIGVDGRKIADFGIGSYIRGLLEGLAGVGSGHDFVIFAPDQVQPVIPSFMERRPFDAAGYSVRELFVLDRLAKEARIDLLHLPHYVVPFTSTPFVVTVHDLIHLHVRPKNPLAPFYARWMISRALRKSARVLTVSEASRRDLGRRFGYPEERVVVTPNGVSSIFSSGEAAVREERTLLFVGNDKPHKNLGTLVAAFESLRASMPDLKLRLVGGRYERFAQVAGVEPRGFVADSELARLYREASILIQPSTIEGFGLPALEAMASGTPVITSSDPALVEVTGNAAIHVDAHSVAGFASAITLVLSDPAIRESMSRGGLARARQFSWRRCAEITLGVYEQVIEEMGRK